MILIAKHKPTNFFNTVRHINLELLTSEQLEEVQQEMKLSQLLHHHNIACYLANFVVGVHLWAVQPLMHYGEATEMGVPNGHVCDDSGFRMECLVWLGRQCYNVIF